jgi:hypothetical protein
MIDSLCGTRPKGFICKLVEGPWGRFCGHRVPERVIIERRQVMDRLDVAVPAPDILLTPAANLLCIERMNSAPVQMALAR